MQERIHACPHGPPALPLCHAEKVMQSSSPPAETPAPATFLLAIDTCGPSGSVALGRFHEGEIEVLGQVELEGRSYSATLVDAVAELLSENKIDLSKLAAIVAVNGPGSFTGVRVGLSAVKGLAEPNPVAQEKIETPAALAFSLRTPSAVASGRSLCRAMAR